MVWLIPRFLEVVHQMSVSEPAAMCQFQSGLPCQKPPANNYLLLSKVSEFAAITSEPCAACALYTPSVFVLDHPMEHIACCPLDMMSSLCIGQQFTIPSLWGICCWPEDHHTHSDCSDCPHRQNLFNVQRLFFFWDIHTSNPGRFRWLLAKFILYTVIGQGTGFQPSYGTQPFQSCPSPCSLAKKKSWWP